MTSIADAQHFGLWSLIVGLVLVTMALTGTVLKRLPLSTAMVYLLVGVALSPFGLGLARFDLREHAVLMERLTEVVVLVSLFTAGLKMSATLRDRRWRPPLRLALLSMVLTVALVTAIGVWGLGLPLGAAVLLGAIVAPTDPVLASDVQVHRPDDRDSLRMALTGEGGLNDGTAFPFVMLGLGLLGLHDLGPWGLYWLSVDVLWAGGAGLLIGALMGMGVGRLVLYLRRAHREAVGLDDLLALGLIGLAYGAAQLSHAYGFLAVFAAGVAFRRVERRETSAAQASGADAASTSVAQVSADPATPGDAMAVDPQHAPAYMAYAVLSFNEQMERIGEVAVVLLLGAMLWAVPWQALPAASQWWWFAPLLLLGVRPLAVSLGLLGSGTTRRHRVLMGWFGIRGIGSVYYLLYAINHGLSDALAAQLTVLTVAVVVLSIFVHGISVTPLMRRYDARGGGQAGAPKP